MPSTWLLTSQTWLITLAFLSLSSQAKPISMSCSFYLQNLSWISPHCLYLLHKPLDHLKILLKCLPVPNCVVWQSILHVVARILFLNKYKSGHDQPSLNPPVASPVFHCTSNKNQTFYHCLEDPHDPPPAQSSSSISAAVSLVLPASWTGLFSTQQLCICSSSSLEHSPLAHQVVGFFSFQIFTESFLLILPYFTLLSVIPLTKLAWTYLRTGGGPSPPRVSELTASSACLL